MRGPLRRAFEPLWTPGAPRVWPIFATALAGASLTVASWLVFSQWEDRAVTQQFNARSSNIASVLQTGVDGYFAKMVALRALFESSPDGVTRTQFEAFASQLLRSQSAILGVSWIPRLAGAEREDEPEGLGGYRIRSLDEQSELAIAPPEYEYFPPSSTLPARPGVVASPTLKLDPGGALAWPAMERARDDDRMATSPSHEAPFEIGDRAGFFAVLPVYKAGEPHDTQADRRHNLLGFVQATFDSGAMARSIFAGVSAPVDLYLLPDGEAPFALFLFGHGAARYRGDLEPGWRDRIAKGPHWTGDVEVADRHWRLVAAPALIVLFAGRPSAWVFLAAGFLLTGGATSWMWGSARYARRLSEANARALRLAHTDELTSLANRRALIEKLARTSADRQEGERPWALFYLDFDHFKDVNDTFGHFVGDALLREAALRIRAAIASDDFAARLGGDEFAVLQDDASSESGTTDLAARVLDSLAEPYRLDGATIRLSASAGIAFSTPAKGDAETMMTHADVSLHRAKDEGRNGWRCHDEAQDRQSQDRARLSEDLRGAIACGEIELHYQPQVEIASGRLVGLEALARWTHARHGPIPPSTFIPIAERAGLIVELGRWVFEEACRQSAAWRREGLSPGIVAVNVSTIQFKRSDFEGELAQSMARWSLDPRAIELELTESVLMDATNEHRDIVERLRRLGVRIAIDDFGTGYSSLSYLANYPVDRLKIAQQLIIGVELDARHASVAGMAIYLARELGVEVIAEGVENQAQARFLISAGCGLAQGYLFGAPMSAAVATERLRDKARSTAARIGIAKLARG